MNSNRHISEDDSKFISGVHNNISPPALPVFLFDLQIRFRFPKINNPTDGHQNLPHIEVLHDR